MIVVELWGGPADGEPNGLCLIDKKPLNRSPSDWFCSHGCQLAWNAQFGVPLPPPPTAPGSWRLP